MNNPDFSAKSGPNPGHFAQKSPDPDQSPEIRTKVGALVTDIIGEEVESRNYLVQLVSE